MEIEVVNKSKPFRQFLEFENFVDDEENDIVENQRYSNINNMTNSSINLVRKEKCIITKRKKMTTSIKSNFFIFSIKIVFINKYINLQKHKY